MWEFITAAIVGAAVSSFSQPKREKIADAPRPEDAMDVIDEINGVQTVIIKGPNGKPRKVTSRLPLTPEEKKVMDWASKLVGETMQNLHGLYQEDPASVPSYTNLLNTFASLDDERTKDLASVMGGDVPQQKKFVDEVNAFKEMHKNALKDNFRRSGNELMEGLVQNGHLDSSAANEMRAHLARDKALAATKIGVDAEMYGRQLSDNTFARDTAIYQMNRAQNAEDFNLREQNRINKLNQAAAEFDLDNQMQAKKIANQQGVLGLANSVISKDLTKAQASKAPEMHNIGYQQQLQGHQSQMNVNQQRFQQRLQTPNIGQTLGNLAVGIGTMGAGYEMMKGVNTGNTGASFTTPQSSIDYTKYFKQPLGRFNYRSS